MKILIPGGSGLLGKPLSRFLASAGHQVWILTRNPAVAHPQTGVEAVQWDGRTGDGWAHLANEVDVIINLAGENIGAGRWTRDRKEQIRNSRVMAGQAIVDAIQKANHKPALVIQASGVGAYGPGDDQWMDETSPYGRDFAASVVVDWESSTRPVEDLGVRRLIIRTGLVMTTRGGWMAPLLIPFRLFVGGPLGSGRQWWPWIHIQDYLGAVSHLLSMPASTGIYNISSPNPAQMKSFGKILARVLSRPYWLPVPGFGLSLLLGERSTLILDGQRVAPKRLLESGYSFHFPEIEPALRDLYG